MMIDDNVGGSGDCYGDRDRDDGDNGVYLVVVADDAGPVVIVPVVVVVVVDDDDDGMIHNSMASTFFLFLFLPVFPSFPFRVGGLFSFTQIKMRTETAKTGVATFGQ